MRGWFLDDRDKDYLLSCEIDPERFRQYKEIFEKGNVHLNIVRPCKTGDGIEVLSEEQKEHFLNIYEEEASKGRCLKFVPASGASTRMFQCLCEILKDETITTIQDVRIRCNDRHYLTKALLFFENLHKLPFYEDLEKWSLSTGKRLQQIIEDGPLRMLVRAVFRRDELGFGSIPKALLPFHRYGSQRRTAFEEHVWEAAAFIKDARNVCRLHFTVSEEHQDAFNRTVLAMQDRFYKDHGINLHITLSLQHASTHTPAVDMNNNLVRDEEGRPLLRPGGHGSLLKNLQECNGDIIFIKNIDNVPTEHTRPLVVLWQKILGGMVIEMERDFHQALVSFDQKSPESLKMGEKVLLKWKQCLPNFYESLGPHEKISCLKDLCDRPKRVCGMVRNVRYPGGGPFWVEESGWMRREIVEKTQLNISNLHSLWMESTHFNPVNIACSVRNSVGNIYDLDRFSDKSAYIIATKHHHGETIKVLEHPGLWNGSMSKWITLFVEIPEETFYPVKEITDLIKKQQL